MAIITLITDHGTKDFYVSSVKGAIYSQFPEAKIIDITHEVPKFDIAQAAFILRNAYKDFPEGTIHIIGVLPNVSSDSPHLAVQCDGQYFIGADNGIFSLIFDKTPDKIVELNITYDSNFPRPIRDVFAKAACHIARGGTLEVIGNPKSDINEKSMFRAVVDNNTIRGTVIYVDNYGNVVTNISEPLFKEVGRGRPFTISFRFPGYDITKISKSYNDVVESERLALFGASNFLEIAINVGEASGLLGLHLKDIVRVEFQDD
ncbi:MAG: hypothetical protein COA57_11500 [Flavobacteriales bacterium]|nr:MAG: hypothetical protein COA57_11500 [Flavobacteriales bacterium]